MSRSIGEHVPAPPNTLLNNRWLVIKEIGHGNFAKVYRCEDTRNPEFPPVAIKIIKKEYAEDGGFENRILRVVSELVPEPYKVVRKLSGCSFLYHGCPAFVFKLCGCTLRQCQLGAYQGSVTVPMIQKFAREMLTTLAFLHDEVRLCHTDLKPENILLDDPSGVPPESGIGEAWTFADFGSASFYNAAKPDSDLISTRPYRAPEVVLSLPWSTKADVWSMACIFFEMYHGGRLFEVDKDPNHLAAYERRLGPIPTTMSRQSKHFASFFNNKAELLVPRFQVGPQRSLKQIVGHEAQFYDFLKFMLVMDPARRPSARQCLQHPFVTGEFLEPGQSPVYAPQLQQQGVMPAAAVVPPVAALPQPQHAQEGAYAYPYGAVPPHVAAPPPYLHLVAVPVQCPMSMVPYPTAMATGAPVLLSTPPTGRVPVAMAQYPPPTLQHQVGGADSNVVYGAVPAMPSHQQHAYYQPQPQPLPGPQPQPQLNPHQSDVVVQPAAAAPPVAVQPESTQQRGKNDEGEEHLVASQLQSPLDESSSWGSGAVSATGFVPMGLGTPGVWSEAPGLGMATGLLSSGFTTSTSASSARATPAEQPMIQQVNNM